MELVYALIEQVDAAATGLALKQARMTDLVGLVAWPGESTEPRTGPLHFRATGDRSRFEAMFADEKGGLGPDRSRRVEGGIELRCAFTGIGRNLTGGSVLYALSLPQDAVPLDLRLRITRGGELRRKVYADPIYRRFGVYLECEINGPLGVDFDFCCTLKVGAAAFARAIATDHDPSFWDGAAISDDDVLLLLNEKQRHPGEPVPVVDVARAAEMAVSECLEVLQRLASRALVDIYPGGPGLSYTNAAVVTQDGTKHARSLMVPIPMGPAAAFATGLSELRTSILDIVVRQQLRQIDAAPTPSEIRTRLEELHPTVDPGAATLTIEALLSELHLRPPTGSVPSYTVTLRGLLHSSWGFAALCLIDLALPALRTLKKEEPSLWLYTWRELRKAAGLPYRALNLAFLAIDLTGLSEKFGTVGSPPSLGWVAPRVDFDLVLGRLKDATEHVASCLAATGKPQPAHGTEAGLPPFGGESKDETPSQSSPPRPPGVFLSHSWEDKEFARRLGNDLRARGARVWIDEAEIKLGDSLIQKIREGIDAMDYLAVVLSPTSVRSEWVLKEVDIAMNQEIAHKRVRVLPLIYKKCELPGFLLGKLYADFSSLDAYDVGLALILRRLELTAEPSPPSGGKVPDGRPQDERSDKSVSAPSSPPADAPPAKHPSKSARRGEQDHVEVDLLLVVVTDVEHAAVIHAAQAITGGEQPRGPIHCEHRTYDDLGTIGGARVAVIQTEMGTSTVGGSLITISTAITEVHPATIIMVGIAFGVDPKKQPIGEVLVSKQVHQYEMQRLGKDVDGKPKITPRGDKATASPSVLSRLRASRSKEDTFRVDFGLLLSGEKLVDNLDYREALSDFEPEALGGEMEGGGLYVAATERHVDWCIVKAVCDYADGNKRDNKKERQKIAADNAAKYVLRAVEAGGFARHGNVTPSKLSVLLRRVKFWLLRPMSLIVLLAALALAWRFGFAQGADFPSVQVNIRNESALRAQTITAVDAEAECLPMSVIPTTRVLDPLTSWDVEIACNSKTRTQVSSPIRIEPNDTGPVRVRFFARNGLGGSVIPSPSFQRVRLSFVTDTSETAYAVEYSLVGGTPKQIGPSVSRPDAALADGALLDATLAGAALPDAALVDAALPDASGSPKTCGMRCEGSGAGTRLRLDPGLQYHFALFKANVKPDKLDEFHVLSEKQDSNLMLVEKSMAPDAFTVSDDALKVCSKLRETGGGCDWSCSVDAVNRTVRLFTNELWAVFRVTCQ